MILVQQYNNSNNNNSQLKFDNTTLLTINLYSKQYKKTLVK